MSRRPAPFTQAAVARALRAIAQTRGDMAVEIDLKTGVVRIESKHGDKPQGPIEPEPEIVL